jgi:hypothetical protein
MALPGECHLLSPGVMMAKHLSVSLQTMNGLSHVAPLSFQLKSNLKIHIDVVAVQCSHPVQLNPIPELFHPTRCSIHSHVTIFQKVLFMLTAKKINASNVPKCLVFLIY